MYQRRKTLKEFAAAFAYVVESAAPNLKTVRERVSRDSRPNALIKYALHAMCSYTGYACGAAKCRFFYKDEEKSFLL
ncbi:hypothetical protein [Anaplasma phagocytophilum]|uniref:hypothetical protein n=1 Tax=Anaplasma phagocytophilum TaxID=948 RepID=UPI0015DF8FEF|nr:hypothetical protein [Anaplasma phagocytophilum]